MSNFHDTGYKEMFSYPELVQQLIEGFAPAEIADMMDFSTLKIQSGHYITPLFEAKVEDVVWAVDINWQGLHQKVYLYILLEFQSSIDSTMPIRLMHYVACFYDHLLKNGTTTPSQGLPPVFPIVLYNGSQRWSAQQDIYDMIAPEPPAFLRPYQPKMRYYLVDEGAYTDEELTQRDSALSGIFSIENATTSLDKLQQGVDRIISIIENDPHKARLDSVITRWIKRHLQRLNANVDLKELHSLVEDKDMLAENLKNWVEKERQINLQEGEKIGIQKGIQRGEDLRARDTARNLIAMGSLSDEQIAQATRLSLDVVQFLRQESAH